MKKILTTQRLQFLAVCAGLALAVTALVPGPLHQSIRESFMSRVESPRYRILFDPNHLSAGAAKDFAEKRESLFSILNRRLGGAADGARITIIFDSSGSVADPVGARRAYSVDGTRIEANPAIPGASAAAPQPELDPAADAEALLHAAWGRPANPEVGYWTALWLLGQRNGEELGMAAAEVEHRVGYKKVSALLSQPSNGASNGGLSPQDRALLAAAWLDEVSEFGGADQVRKLYTTRVSKFDVAAATAALGTTTSELERKWQLWLYSYLAGMPTGPSNSMPNMPGMPMPSADASH